MRGWKTVTLEKLACELDPKWAAWSGKLSIAVNVSGPRVSCRKLRFGSLERDDSIPQPAYRVWIGCHGNRGRRALAEQRDGSVKQQDVIYTLGKQSKCTLTPNRTGVSLTMISSILPTWILTVSRGLMANGLIAALCFLADGCNGNDGMECWEVFQSKGKVLF